MSYHTAAGITRNRQELRPSLKIADNPGLAATEYLFWDTTSSGCSICQ